MTIHDILEKELPKLGIREINWGGCGIFAVQLYKMLESLGYNPSIVMFTYDRTVRAIHYNRTNNTPENIFGTYQAACRHAVIRLDDKDYDGEGRVRLYTWGETKVYVNIEEMELAVEKWGWNSDFDKYLYVPKITEFLQNLKTLIKNVNTKLLPFPAGGYIS